MDPDDANTPPASRRRAELKQAYKEAPPAAGVFAVRNLKSGKVLVGSSMNVQGSLNGLRFQLEARACRVSPELQTDWVQQGADAFSFEVLDRLPPPKDPGVDPREELQVLEALWLERLKPYAPAGYNAPKG